MLLRRELRSSTYTYCRVYLNHHYHYLRKMCVPILIYFWGLTQHGWQLTVDYLYGNGRKVVYSTKGIKFTQQTEVRGCGKNLTTYRWWLISAFGCMWWYQSSFVVISFVILLTIINKLPWMISRLFRAVHLRCVVCCSFQTFPSFIRQIKLCLLDVYCSQSTATVWTVY